MPWFIIAILLLGFCCSACFGLFLKRRYDRVCSLWNEGRCLCFGSWRPFSQSSPSERSYRMFKCENCDSVIDLS